MTAFRHFFFAIALLCHCTTSAQSDSLKWQRKSQLYWYSGVSIAYLSSMSLLYQTWYAPYNTGQFHFFNDNAQWGGMDKIGHFTTTWWMADFIRSSAASSGLSQQQALKLGLLVPFVYTSTIEVFDGFSEGWGFSTGDLLANLGGIGFSYLQYRIPRLNEASIRYSYTNDAWPALRPELLGTAGPERMLKNYNGQAYWLSVPVKWMIPSSPPWLLVSAGYSIDGYLGGSSNVYFEQQQWINFGHVQRNPEIFLSLDIDLRKIPIQGKAWTLFTQLFRWVKIPAPTLAFCPNKGVQLHPLRW